MKRSKKSYMALVLSAAMALSSVPPVKVNAAETGAKEVMSEQAQEESLATATDAAFAEADDRQNENTEQTPGSGNAADSQEVLPEETLPQTVDWTLPAQESAKAVSSKTENKPEVIPAVIWLGEEIGSLSKASGSDENVAGETDGDDPDSQEEPASQYADGTYSLKITSSYGMFKVAEEASAVVKGSTMTVTLSTTSKTYDKIYLGSIAAEDKTPVISGVENQQGGYDFTFDVDVSQLGSSLNFVPGKPDGSWYVKKQSSLTFPDSMAKIETAAPDPNPDPNPDPDPDQDQNQDTLEDGNYSIAEVTSSSSMFKVVACTMSVENGIKNVTVTLSGTGYDTLYVGTAEQAALAADTELISYTLDEDGKYTFTFSIDELDTEVKLAAHSKSKNLWYDRTLTFSSEGMTKLPDASEEEGEEDEDKKTEEPAEKDPSAGDKEETDNQKPGTDSDIDLSVGETDKNTEDDNKNISVADTESKYEADISGSTKRVDSSTALPDGVYKPEQFSWSGGTGRVNISCNKVTVKDGKAYATIVFSSDSYSYVKANGNKYTGSCGGGTSTFVIPVQLNANNRILGMTTKMSAAHEIEYSIYVALTEGTGEEKTEAAVSQNTTLDEEAPDIIGLEYESETELEHAQYFKIYHYNDGITLLEIDTAKDTDRECEEEEAFTDEESFDADAMEAATAEETSEEATVRSQEEIASELYQANIVKYLIVPEDVEIPAGLDKEMIVVQLPVEKSYVATQEGLSSMEELSLLEMISAVGFSQEEITITALAERMEASEATEEPEVVFAGSYEEPDYKTLIKNQISLAILPSDLLPREVEDEENSEEEVLTVEEQTERYNDITGYFATLSIPVVIDRSKDEETDLAKYEWIKVYGALFGCEEEANQLYNAAQENYNEENRNQ